MASSGASVVLSPTNKRAERALRFWGPLISVLPWDIEYQEQPLGRTDFVPQSNMSSPSPIHLSHAG